MYISTYTIFTHTNVLKVATKRSDVHSRFFGCLDRCGNVPVPLSHEDRVREVSSSF